MSNLVAGTMLMLATLAAWTLGGCATVPKHPQNADGASAPNASPPTLSGRLLSYPSAPLEASPVP